MKPVGNQKREHEQSAGRRGVAAGCVRAPLTRFINARAGELRLSIREIAQRLDGLPKNAASRATVGRWFAGNSIPGDLEIAALARVLQAPDALLRGLGSVSGTTGHTVAPDACPWALATAIIRSRPRTLFVAGAAAAALAARIVESERLSATTVLASLHDPLAAHACRTGANAARTAADSLPSLWLAAVDGLLHLARPPAANHVCILVRGDLDVAPEGKDREIIGDEWMFVTIPSMQFAAPAIRVRNEPDWQSAATLFDSLRTRASSPESRITFDSDWAEGDRQRRRFTRLRARVAQAAAHSFARRADDG